VDNPVEIRRNSTKAHDIVGFRLDSENPLVAGARYSAQLLHTSGWKSG